MPESEGDGGNASPPERPGARGFTNDSSSGHARSNTMGKVNGLGRTNGLTNGRTNGLTNGDRAGRYAGLTNGRTNGLTNGFVNGAGAVNGYRLSVTTRDIKHPADSSKKKILTVTLLVLIMLAIPYALVYTFPPSEIDIDGYFMDWLEASIYSDIPDSENLDTALVEYAVSTDESKTSFYVSTSGTIMGGADGGADGFFIFMDVDGSASTGYSVRGLGADAMTAVIGWDRETRLMMTYVFGEDADQDNYAGFEPRSKPIVSFKEGNLEMSTDISTDESSIFAICARHSGSQDDWSDVNFASGGPALRVNQFHRAPLVTTGTNDEMMLTISITNKGSSVRLTGFNFEFLGDATIAEISVLSGNDLYATGSSPEVTFEQGVDIGRGRTVSFEIAVTTTADSWGRAVGLSLSSTDALMLERSSPVRIDTYQTDSMISYIGQAPTGISIDGAFGDWDLRLPSTDPSGDVLLDGTNRSDKMDIDINAVKVSANSESVSFFMSVDGRMLGGADIPGAIARWETSDIPASDLPNATVQQPKYGADSAFVFIDIDKNESTGFYIGGAEVAISIVGKNGRIFNASAFAYSEYGWTWLGEVDAALDHYRIEVAASFAMLGIEQDEIYPITFMSKDWEGAQDWVFSSVSTHASLGFREFGGIIINELYSYQPSISNDWVELYNTGTVAINIGGWTLYSGTTLLFTFPDVWVGPGEFYVTPLISLYKLQVFTLYDDEGTLIDSIAVPLWNARSYGRIGTPGDEYATWGWMVPTPGEINQGQIPVPEFGDLLAPLAIVPIMFLLIRRTRTARRTSRGEAEGKKHD